MKKSLLTAAILALTTGAFAFDEYGTMAKGKTEVDVMVSQDLTGEVTYPALQVKYGIMDGLDVEAVLPMTITSDVSGLAQPNLGLKYLHATSGVGGFVAVDLPFGSEDIVSDDPATVIYTSLLYSKVHGPVALNAWALYKFASDAAGDGAFDLYVKPQYNVTDKIGPYLGLDMIKYKDVDPFYTVRPGINYIVNDLVAVEANYSLGIPSEGDNVHGVYGGVYFVF
jgi:hypothetical protein